MGILLFLTIACPMWFLEYYSGKAWRYLTGETALQKARKLLGDIRIKSAENLLPPEMRDRLRVIELKVEEIEKDLDHPEPWVSIKKIDPPPEDDS
ncbi:MAG: hypothetical protein Q8P59_07075 [Dehalococcoidia bacterium]|nr:hypothetical protein [Dehalococcoidia bacterium]